MKSGINSTKKINISLIILLALTIVSGSALTSTLVSADDVVDDVVVTVPTSCTMSGSGMTSHNANLQNGSYTPNIGTTTMNVFCNDTNGFSIYAIGFSGDELGTEDSTKLLGTSASNDAKIATGTATSAGNPDVSNWAMKLSTDSQATYPVTLENNFGSYHAVPSEYTQVAMRDASTDVGQNAAGSTITSTYAAYISRTQPADTYSGKVKYVLVHPNDGAAPVIPTASTCNTPVPNLTYMQDLNSSNKASILAGMTEDQQYFLKDKRDEKTYCVARLKDGNIWMTQNLDLDIDSTKTYTSADTDVPANWTPVASTHATNDTEWNSYDETNNPDGGDNYHPESYDPGDLYWNGHTTDYEFEDETECETAGGTWDGNWCDMGDYTASSGNSHYHLGNYYNWSAAVATNDTSSYTTQYQDLDRSICPANWTLPKGGDVVQSPTSGSFQYLVEQYGWDSDFYMMENPNIWNTAIKSALAGGWYGSLGGVGGFGGWWSPVVKDSGGAYRLDADINGLVSPDLGSDRGNGLSVRCVSR